MTTVNQAYDDLVATLKKHLASMTENERLTLLHRLVTEVTKLEDVELGSNSG